MNLPIQPPDDVHEFVEMMKAEHRDLFEVIQDVQQAMTSQLRDTQTVDVLLKRLTEKLLNHFAFEEKDGYLHEATDEEPRLKSRADALLNQHTMMRAELTKLSEFVKTSDNSESWWESFQAQFKHFLEHLKKHEMAENQLVQEAFTDDIGSKD